MLMARVSILGAGYVGLVTGAGLAELGHDVVCVESAPDRLAVLEGGDIPIHEPGLSALIDRHRASRRLRFTGEYARAIPAAEFVFIAVNTPAGPDGAANTAHVFAAVGSMLEHGHAGQIIVTSTVPVGTGDAIADRSRTPLRH
jgi:UDPglucose 6-dehydrogenase